MPLQETYIGSCGPVQLKLPQLCQSLVHTLYYLPHSSDFPSLKTKLWLTVVARSRLSPSAPWSTEPLLSA